MMKKILLLVVFCLYLSSATAFGITGRSFNPITFKPGEVTSNSYEIIGATKAYNVSVSGDPVINDFLSITQVKDNRFDLIITFPPEIPQPGEYPFEISVFEQKESNSGGVSAFVGIQKQFRMVIYSREKEVKVSLSAPSVNVGTPVEFKVNVESQTYSKIASVSAKIKVYDLQNKTVGSLQTEKKSLQALDSISLPAKFDTKDLPPAEYWAEALVSYDGKKKSATAPFRIGNFNLILKNYTSTLMPGFNEFFIWAINDWGNPLNNVYAKVYLNGEQLLHTSTIDLSPWQEAQLSGIVKVTVPEGQYNGAIELFFEGEHKSEPVIFQVIAEQKPIVLWILIGLVVVIIVIIIIYFWRKRNLSVSEDNKPFKEDATSKLDSKK